MGESGCSTLAPGLRDASMNVSSALMARKRSFKQRQRGSDLGVHGAQSGDLLVERGTAELERDGEIRGGDATRPLFGHEHPHCSYR